MPTYKLYYHEEDGKSIYKVYVVTEKKEVFLLDYIFPTELAKITNDFELFYNCKYYNIPSKNDPFFYKSPQQLFYILDLIIEAEKERLSSI